MDRRNPLPAAVLVPWLADVGFKPHTDNVYVHRCPDCGHEVESFKECAVYCTQGHRMRRMRVSARACGLGMK